MLNIDQTSYLQKMGITKYKLFEALLKTPQ